MAKMRVHELAKELNIESKSIVDFLSTTEYAVKTAIPADIYQNLEEEMSKVAK